MQGLHLSADLRGVKPTLAPMRDADTLAALCSAAVTQAGLTGVAELFHRFSPDDEQSGITGVVLLAASGRLLADARLQAVSLGKQAVPVWLAAGIFAVIDAVFLVILLREKAAAAAPAPAARGLQEMGEPR